MKVFGVITLVIVVGVFGYWFFNQSQKEVDLDMVTIQSGSGVEIVAKVADTETERRKGLSFTPSLSEQEGMWFIFPEDGIYGIWMKDMQIPLDILWIDANFQIIHREINISPETYPQTFSSTEKSRYVLEVPANTADKNGFLLGSEIFIQK